MTTARPALDIRQVKIGPLSDRNVLAEFQSGEHEIDRAIGKCCDWQEKHRVRMFCATMADCVHAYGFYALGVSAADSKYLSGEIVQGAEDRSYIPFIYLNYLAVQSEFQNQKLGTLMLIDALKRCESVARNVGLYGVALNALSDRAAGLYDRYGFRAYSQTKFPLMVLPIQSLFDLVGG
jgi:ribosomal protein S18 acetylase RimI-like enzyme